MYKSGQVVLVKFHPSHGAEIKKYRPAVVISEATEQADSRLVMVAPLTSSSRKKKNDFEIALDKMPFLEKESTLLLWYPLTIDIQRVQYLLGSLTKKTTQSIQKQARLLFKE